MDLQEKLQILTVIMAILDVILLFVGLSKGDLKGIAYAIVLTFVVSGMDFYDGCKLYITRPLTRPTRQSLKTTRSLLKS